MVRIRPILTAEYIAALETALKLEKLSTRRDENKVAELDGLLSIVIVRKPSLLLPFLASPLFTLHRSRQPVWMACVLLCICVLSQVPLLLEFYHSSRIPGDTPLTITGTAPPPRAQKGVAKVDSDAQRLSAPADRLKRLLSSPKASVPPHVTSRI